MTMLDESAWNAARLAQLLLHSAGEGIVILDGELRCRVWNPLLERLTGVSSAHAVGREFAELFPEMVQLGGVAHLQRALIGETVAAPDLPITAPNGKTSWFVGIYRPFVDEGGHVIGVIGHLNETTSRRDSEEKLRRSEARLRAIVEGGSDLVVILDKRGKAHWISPTLPATLGISIDNLLGKNPIELVHQDDKARVLNSFLTTLGEQGATHRVQYRARHASGAWRTLATTSRNLLHDPAVQGVVTSTRDVTEWQELQERLHQSQKIEAVGRLAGGVAHDYNNLLTVIVGNARLLLAEEEITGERRDELEEIAQAAERAATLTRQLLAFSRQQVLQPRLLNLNDVVTGMWKLLDRLSGEGVVNERRLTEPLGDVMADPVQIEQVLINLVVNARDAMPDGGSLTIETSNAPVDSREAVRRLPMPAGDYVLLAVHDSGSGMDAKTLARAFEPFFTTKPLGAGSGMGLSTVYGIVKQSDGFIWAESAPGKGASFRIYLPRVVAPEARNADASRSRTPVAVGTETIVVAEDEPLVRAMTRRTLERAGYRVYDAPNGAEALRLVRSLPTPPSLLITDIVMPVMGGRELASTVEREYPGLRILFMSGYTQERQAHLTDSDGVSRFLHKPFSLDELRNRVRLLLDHTNSAA